MAVKNQQSLTEFYHKKRILITGASGYIAWNLIKQLAEYDCTIVCLSRNVEKIEKQNENANFNFIVASYQNEVAFQKAVKNIDIIFHLASQTSVYEAEKNPLTDYEANVRPMQLLLEACRKIDNCPIIVFSGTSTQCGIPKELPVDENVIDEPITTYDFHKLQAERWLKFYTSQGWVKGVSLRLANVYGPGPKSGSADRGILNMMIRKALQGEDITLYGKGENLRDYIYVKDVVNAFLLAGMKIDDLNGQHFVIGSGECNTICEAFEMVANCVEHFTRKRVDVISVNPPESLSTIEKRNFAANISGVKKAIGWEPKINLFYGIQKTVEFYAKKTS